MALRWTQWVDLTSRRQAGTGADAGEIGAIVRSDLSDWAGELKSCREGLEHFLVGGSDRGWVQAETREDNIALYHRDIEHVSDRIRCAERFLEMIEG